MNIQKVIQTIPDDRELFLILVEQFNQNPKDVNLAYCIFLGAYYHDKKYGVKAINAIQKYSNAKQFNIFNSMVTQSHFYLRKAPGTRKQLSLHLNRVGDYVDERWRALNPFIAPASSENPNEVYVGIRMTNFDKEGTRYFAAHGGNIKNFYEGQAYDLSNHKVENIHQYRDLTVYKKYTNEWYHVEGLEDFRVASYQNKEGKIRYIALVVSIDAHNEGFPQEQFPRQSLVDVEFTSAENSSYLEVKNLRPLRGLYVDNHVAQKNWLPFFDQDGQLYAIYSTSEFTILKIDENTGKCEKVGDETKNFNKGTIHFRGSSPPIPYKENYLYSVHIVGFLPEGRGRVYYHRLVEINLNDYEIKRISNMFYLNEKNTVEYISGAYNDGSTIHFTYGFDDKQAWIASLTYTEIEILFSPY